MFGRKLLAIVIGAAIIVGNCSAGGKLITGRLLIDQSFLTYSLALQKPTTTTQAIFKIFFTIDKSITESTSYTISDEVWLLNPNLRDQFLSKFSEAFNKSQGASLGAIFVKKLSEQMREAVPAEMNMLKQYLGIEANIELSMGDLIKRKANFDTENAQQWIGEVDSTKTPEERKKILDNINNALIYFLSLYKVDGSAKDWRFLMKYQESYILNNLLLRPMYLMTRIN